MKGDTLVIGIGILLLVLVVLGLFLFTAGSSQQMLQPPVAPVGTVAPAAAAAPTVEESTVILTREVEELPEDSNEETVPEGLDDER